MAAGPETEIITNEKLIRASGEESSGPAVAAEFRAAEASREDLAAAAMPEPLGWYGNSAYGTGDLRGAVADAAHQAAIKPKPLRPAVEGGFTIDDFAVDEPAETVTCLAGHTVALSRALTRPVDAHPETRGAGPA